MISRSDLLDLEYTDLLRKAYYEPKYAKSAWEHLKILGVPISEDYELLPHQLEALDWLSLREKEHYMGMNGALVCLAMGLGKTLISVIHMLSHPLDEYPNLVVCSLTLLNVWLDELKKFLGEEYVVQNILVLHQTHNKVWTITKKQLKKYKIVLTTYDVCRSAYKGLSKGFRNDSGGCTKSKKNGPTKASKSKTRKQKKRRKDEDSESDSNNEEEILKVYEKYNFGYYESNANNKKDTSSDEEPNTKKKANSSSDEKPRNNKKNPATEDKGKYLIYTVPWTRVIADESQKFANLNSNVYHAMCAIKAPRRICLSGTPIRNYETDILAQLIFLGLFPTPSKKDWSSIRFDSLCLRQMILQMDYEYANIELPDRDDYNISIVFEETQQDFYNYLEAEAKKKYWDMLRNIVNYECILEFFLMLRQACVAPYLITRAESRKNYSQRIGEEAEDKSVGEWINDRNSSACLKSAKTVQLLKLLEDIDKKVLVFSMFTTYLDIVREELERRKRPVLLLTGEVTGKNRAILLKEFQESELPYVLLLNYKVGSEGLNLTECHHAVFVEFWWNASVLLQAAARVWRIGQKEKVSCYYLVAKNTIEERMIKLCETKVNIADNYLGNGTSKLSKGGLSKEAMASLLGLAA